MSRDLVHRLIAFLKKPEALEYNEAPRNTYDDYDRHPAYEEPSGQQYAYDSYGEMQNHRDESPFIGSASRSPGQASRLDAVVMRAVQQFNAYQGYVFRYEHDGRMHYCTGRDGQGRYVSHTDVIPDRRAVFLALDSGESQLFVHTLDDNTPVAVLCGPLRDRDEVIGVLYLDNPARSSLHRGVFDVFCDQAARTLTEGSV